MGLVIGAAALQALLYLLFSVFENRRIPLMPGIAVNYVVAMILGLLYAPPWQAGDLSPLWLPSLGIGALFVVVFSLTGLDHPAFGSCGKYRGQQDERGAHCAFRSGGPP